MGISMGIKAQEGKFGVIETQASDVFERLIAKCGDDPLCDSCKKEHKGNATNCAVYLEGPVTAYYPWWISCDGRDCVRSERPMLSKDSALNYAKSEYELNRRHYEPVEGLDKTVEYWMIGTWERCDCAGIVTRTGEVFMNAPSGVSSGGGCSLLIRNKEKAGPYLLPGHMGLAFYDLARKLKDAGYDVRMASTESDLPDGLVNRFSAEERQKILEVCTEIQFEFEGINERAYTETSLVSSEQATKLIEELGFVKGSQWTGCDFRDAYGIIECLKGRTILPRRRTVA